MIYFILNEHTAEEFDNRMYYFTDLHEDVLDYMRIQGKVNLVNSCDYIFRVIEGKIFYLKNRTGLNYQFTEEELVILRLKSAKL